MITGGAGFVASDVAEKLAADPANEVVVVDNLLTGELSKVPSGVTFIKCDVNRFEDISGVFYAYRFDHVFHYAAVVGVKRTTDNPVMVLRDIDGIRNVLDLSKNTGVKRVLFSSSSEVYGEPVEIPQNERTTPLNSKLRPGPAHVCRHTLVECAVVHSTQTSHALPMHVPHNKCQHGCS